MTVSYWYQYMKADTTKEDIKEYAKELGMVEVDPK